MEFIGTAWSLLPAIIAILLALITKEVYLSLFIGIVSGALLYTNFSFIRFGNYSEKLFAAYKFIVFREISYTYKQHLSEKSIKSEIVRIMLGSLFSKVYPFRGEHFGNIEYTFSVGRSISSAFSGMLGVKGIPSADETFCLLNFKF